jgi:hypothetical protein
MAACASRRREDALALRGGIAATRPGLGGARLLAGLGRGLAGLGRGLAGRLRARGRLRVGRAGLRRLALRRFRTRGVFLGRLAPDDEPDRPCAERERDREEDERRLRGDERQPPPAPSLRPARPSHRGTIPRRPASDAGPAAVRHDDAVSRLVIAMPLRQGVRDDARRLLAEGPPFALEETRFDRHEVYLAASEAVTWRRGDCV